MRTRLHRKPTSVAASLLFSSLSLLTGCTQLSTQPEASTSPTPPDAAGAPSGTTTQAGDTPSGDAGSPSSQPCGSASAPCQAPTATDGVKNGDETDIDCGGATAPKCAAKKSCQTHADCASGGCAYDKKCATGRSCTAHFGGDTCGVGEDGAPGATHVSCCETAPLFDDMQQIQLDRFLITAGRMRAFVERLDGDVRSYVHTLPADKWHTDWDDTLVPSNLPEADVQLGSYFDKKSCHPGDHTGRTYWTPPKPDDFSDFNKDQLDEKALNCVTWQLVAAFCAWDGGRMPTSAELRNAFTESGRYAQPWLWKPGAESYVQNNEFTEPAPLTQIMNHAFGYGYPTVPGMRLDENGKPGLDVAYYISPPGRFPTSWNEHGHEVAGNLLTWNADGPFIATRNYSWENHGGDDLADTDWKEFEQTADIASNGPNGYYAIGGRCAHDP